MGARKMDGMMEAMMNMLDSTGKDRDNALFVLHQESSLPYEVCLKLISLLESGNLDFQKNILSNLASKEDLPTEAGEKIAELLKSDDLEVLGEYIFTLVEVEPTDLRILSSFFEALDRFPKKALVQIINALGLWDNIHDLTKDFLKKHIENVDVDVQIASIDALSYNETYISHAKGPLIKKLELSAQPVVRYLSYLALSEIELEGAELRTFEEYTQNEDLASNDFDAHLDYKLSKYDEDELQVDEAEEEKEITSVSLGELKKFGRLLGESTRLINSYLFDLEHEDEPADPSVLGIAIQKLLLSLNAFAEDDKDNRSLTPAYVNLHMAYFLLNDHHNAKKHIDLAESCYKGTNDPYVCVAKGAYLKETSDDLKLAKEYVLRGFVMSGGEALRMGNAKKLLKFIGRSEDLFEDDNADIKNDTDLINYKKIQNLSEVAKSIFEEYSDKLSDAGFQWRVNTHDRKGLLNRPHQELLQKGISMMEEAWSLLPEPKTKWEISEEITHDLYWYHQEAGNTDQKILFLELSCKSMEESMSGQTYFDLGEMHYHEKKDLETARLYFQKSWDLDGDEHFSEYNEHNDQYLKLIGEQPKKS